MSDPQNTYRKCVEFEEKAAAIYLKMASRFSLENAELSELWFEMGMQEKQHAGLLEFCLIEGMIAPCEVESAIHRIETTLPILESRAGDPKLSIQGAFEIAIALETSEVNEIYQHLTTPVHKSTYLLRRKIMSGTPDHEELLRQAARKFGVEMGDALLNPRISKEFGD